MKLIILGTNGSIGRTTLKVLSKYKKTYEIIGLSFGDNIDDIDKIIKYFHPLYISLKNEKDYINLKNKYENMIFFYGLDSYLKLLDCEYDALINGLSGFIGLEPSIRCLSDNKTLLLANKESLIVGGEIIENILKTSGKLIPIDSEHVAIKKCLYKENKENVEKIIITASGGPFFNYSDEKLKNVDINKALNHPTWKMGKRITIDSSTFINKCFELIEAYYLFKDYSLNYGVLVDQKSFIHGLVIFKDGRIKMCKYSPTMENPIKYALDSLFNKEIDLSDVYQIEKIDESLKEVKNRYKFIFELSNRVAKYKGNSGVILNAIDEELVNLFLSNKINYIDITRIIVKIMNTYKFKESLNLRDLKNEDKLARKAIKDLIEGNRYEN